MPENLTSIVGSRATIAVLMMANDHGVKTPTDCYRITVSDPASLWDVAKDILIDGWAVAQIDKTTLFVGAEIN